MKTMSLSQFLLVLLVLPVMWSCKKDKDPLPINQNPPQPTIRQASLEANINVDQVDSFIIYEGDQLNNGAIGATYLVSENRIAITSNRSIDSGIVSLVFEAIIPSLEIGENSLTVGEDESSGYYSNSSLSTQLFSITSGDLNITAVDVVPSSLTLLNSRYVSGTFFFTMENDNAGTNIVAQGSFTDVLVLVLE